MDERLLIERLKLGDEAAFKWVVDTWQDMIYNTALGIVQNEQDAEDVAQDVFVQAFRGIGSFKGEAKLSTWLYRIAITRALDIERKKGRKKRRGIWQSLFGKEGEPIGELADFHHPGVRLEQKEQSARLFQAIGRLPDNQKVAYTLHKLEGLSYQEISAVMENSVSAVESLMHRAKTNLRKELEGIIKS